MAPIHPSVLVTKFSFTISTTRKSTRDGRLSLSARHQNNPLRTAPHRQVNIGRVFYFAPLMRLSILSQAAGALGLKKKYIHACIKGRIRTASMVWHDGHQVVRHNTRSNLLVEDGSRGAGKATGAEMVATRGTTATFGVEFLGWRF